MNDTKCHCGCGLDITNQMRIILQNLESAMQKEITSNYQLNVTCGARCAKHNAEVGGVPNSAHIAGEAGDIGLATSHERFLFLKIIFSIGISRIEDRLLNHSYIHIDRATGVVPIPTDTLKEYPQEVFIVLP